jgi:hypothetical protein
VARVPDDGQNPSNSEYYTQSSEPFRICLQRQRVARTGILIWLQCCLLSWCYPRVFQFHLAAPCLNWYLWLCFNRYLNSSLRPHPNDGSASLYTATPLLDICIGGWIGKHPLVLHPSPCDLNTADTVYVHFMGLSPNSSFNKMTGFGLSDWSSIRDRASSFRSSRYQPDSSSVGTGK